MNAEPIERTLAECRAELDVEQAVPRMNHCAPQYQRICFQVVQAFFARKSEGEDSIHRPSNPIVECPIRICERKRPKPVVAQVLSRTNQLISNRVIGDRRQIGMGSSVRADLDPAHRPV